MNLPITLAEMDWVNLSSFAFTIILQVIGLAVVLTKMHTGLEAVKEVQARQEQMPERVLKLENVFDNVVTTRAELKLQNDRDHQSIREDVGRIRERQHELSSTVQKVDLSLEFFKKEIGEMKEMLREMTRKHAE